MDKLVGKGQIPFYGVISLSCGEREVCQAFAFSFELITILYQDTLILILIFKCVPLKQNSKVPCEMKNSPTELYFYMYDHHSMASQYYVINLQVPDFKLISSVVFKDMSYV